MPKKNLIPEVESGKKDEELVATGLLEEISATGLWVPKGWTPKTQSNHKF